MTVTRLLLFAACAALLSPAAPAQSPLNIVATTTHMGMLAQTVGGDAVKVTVLAPPGRDAHHLQVRPSMMAALRRADLVVAVGADLEIGWLPPAIRGASNPAIRPGGNGYFEAAQAVELIDAGRPADRAQGDIHPAGNPHIYLDPVRMATAARALAGQLAGLRPAQADLYRDNAAAFAAAVDERLPVWRERSATAPGIVLFHEDARYLTELLGVRIHGYLEPLPGIPPTASHLNDLVRRLEGESGIVIHAEFHPPQGPDFLARELGWPVRQLAHDLPAGNLDSENYFALIDAWVDALDGGR